MKKTEDRQNEVLVNHEKIHFYQQMELLIIPFYIWYLVEYFLKYLKYRNPQLAYRNISFEREAYENEENPDFLKTRTFWNFLKYL